ncbi:MAG TPA: TatD family hydrolase [Chroococcales cyanobacterium]
MPVNLPLPEIPPGLKIIDSHAHVVKEYFQDDQDEVIGRAHDCGVVQLVNPGVVTDNIDELLSIAGSHDFIYTSVGVHPHEASHWTEESKRLMSAALTNERVVGVGECGLDFYYNHSDRQSQMHALKEQVKLALAFDKPIIIHCREAWNETLDILEQEGGGKLRGVFHCFTGGPEVLPRIEGLDFYVSFSGIVTFPKSQEIQAAAALVREDRFLVETDCPYLAPQKVRGKRNEPAYVWWVADKLRELRQSDLSSIAQSCCRNARALFRLPEPG